MRSLDDGTSAAEQTARGTRFGGWTGRRQGDAHQVASCASGTRAAYRPSGAGVFGASGASAVAGPG
ncbi:MAG: hypothetical protein ACRDSO_00485, partial [Pseudonocardiaceae bacterium]